MISATELENDWIAVLEDYFYIPGLVPLDHQEFFRFAEFVARALSTGFTGVRPSSCRYASVIIQAFLARCQMPHLNIPSCNHNDPRIDLSLAKYRQIAPIEFGGSGGPV